MYVRISVRFLFASSIHKLRAYSPTVQQDKIVIISYIEQGSLDMIWKAGDINRAIKNVGF